MSEMSWLKREAYDTFPKDSVDEWAIVGIENMWMQRTFFPAEEKRLDGVTSLAAR